MDTDTKENDPQGGEDDLDSGTPRGGPLRVLFAPDPKVWNEARRMVTDKSVRVTDFATCAAQDPVLVIELLRKSNALFFSGGRSPITTVKSAIVRLGYDVVLELLEMLADRPALQAPDVQQWFELYRSKGRRSSIIARIIAEAVQNRFY